MIPQGAAHAMVDACRAQVELHFTPAWSRLPALPQLFEGRALVPRGMPLLVLVDSSDQAGALGYHTQEFDGDIVGIVAAAPVLVAGGSLLTGSLSVAAVLSHEILETHADPFVNIWADGPDGRLWAFEMCDPVQDGWYDINGVAVSSFVMPAFWDRWAPVGARFDWLGALQAPFSLTLGGYAVVRTGTGEVLQIGAAKPAWKVTSRSARRAL